MSLDKIQPCPASPNCVSTLADPDDNEHHMDAFAFTVTVEEALDVIVEVLGERSRTEVTSRTDTAVEAVATMRIPIWKDDVVFALDIDAGLVHFRSASRMGKSDLGKNRSRMEELRSAIEPRVQQA